ncbi:NAD(P)/FAD-dependent oxidoreductase [Nocardioides solisilvae]|uniref:NAD(P)/FAD-dependent oxidoreductase n=1 Tax=Nocardioides solisilvae TaxID=1542435 RepID=UPI000D749E1B|nr:FAD-dependent oxidoreductase [Nocardioides solisilvae]
MGAQRPEHVAVVGAGMVGLATAWFLQEQGVRVTVLDRTGVAAGSSWGNAGWLTPGLATPLPEPAVLKYGIRAVVSPKSPVYVPLSTDRRLLSFLVRFARNSTMPRWREAMRALVPVNSLALDDFDRLREGGVEAPTPEARPFLAAYRTPAERATLLEEIEHIRASGQPLEYDVLTGDEARALEPALSPAIGAAIRLDGQRYLTPSTYVAALAEQVRHRGARIVSGVQVDTVKQRGDQVQVAGEAYDAVVIASGAWLNQLAKPFGVSLPVQAGRGYSFTVPIDPVPAGPVYFPAQRVACTPDGDRLRIAGMMEFRPADAGLDTRRIEAIVDAARPLLRGAELGSRRDEWVGARPCTPDGLPLVGATRSDRVFVAGGHGMWGITLGPVTGRLLAERIVTGVLPEPLRPFDPLRS